jgi:hypothetical protein
MTDPTDIATFKNSHARRDTTSPTSAPYLGETHQRRGDPMQPSATTTATPGANPPTADQVADLLDAVAAANLRITIEVSRIAVDNTPISPATIERLTTLARQVRPGALARAQLSGLDRAVLLAGTSVWLERQRATTHSATARAQSRWGVLPT